MSETGAPPLPPLQIPFTPEGMGMVSAMLQGMAGAMDKQAIEISHLRKSADGQTTGGQS